MKLEIFKDTDARIPRTRIERLFRRVVRGEGFGRREGAINLIMTDNRRLKRLNRDFRSKNSPTDVLSFNLDSTDDPDAVFGEIYISAEYARSQAEARGGRVWNEYLLLVCHGLLHLFGYDHADQRQESAMFALQNKYLGRGV